MNDTDTLNMLNISYDLIEQGELILSWLNQKRVKNWSEKKDTKRKTKQTNKQKKTNKKKKQGKNTWLSFGSWTKKSIRPAIRTD